MTFPLGTLLDPARKQVDLLGGEASSAFWRRHPQLRVVGADSFEQLALIGLSRNDDADSVGRPEQAFAEVEPQIRLSLVLVGTMALITRFRKDRTDLSVEINVRRTIAGLGKGRQEERESARRYPRYRSYHSHHRLLHREDEPSLNSEDLAVIAGPFCKGREKLAGDADRPKGATSRDSV